MSDEDESSKKRAHPRYPVDWRVTLRCPDWPFARKLAASNASRTGLFLLTTRAPNVGSTVEVVIQLPDGSQLKVHATVQHIVTPERAAAEGRAPGIGVKLDARHEIDMLLLEEIAIAGSRV